MPTPKKILLLLGLSTAILAFWVFGLNEYLSFESLKLREDALRVHYQENQAISLGIYFLAYVAMAALSLPGATIMTVAAGALLDFFTALLVVSFASSIGATLNFLAARYLFREGVERRFGERLRTINAGIEREGAFYLFTLRLIPLFPFFLINLALGLSTMRAWTFYWVSQVGMLAGTAVYINAGTQLGQLDSLRGILSPSLLASFALVGVFPLLAKKALVFFKARQKTPSRE